MEVMELRMREKGLLAVNDIFGPPMGVLNEIMRAWLDKWNAEKEEMAREENFDFNEWIGRQLALKGFKRIPNNQLFSRTEGVWEKEYKIVQTV
jgi:hypothetical protein